MSTENLQAFLHQARFPSEDVIRGAGTRESFARLVVGLGAEQGFDFSEADVLRTIEATTEPASVELSDERLDEVAGGKVDLQIKFTKPETMQELYQDWADLGHILKTVYR